MSPFFSFKRQDTTKHLSLCYEDLVSKIIVGKIFFYIETASACGMSHYIFHKRYKIIIPTQCFYHFSAILIGRLAK